MNTADLHSELEFRTSRSSGSGGQHVNKVESRVELIFDVEGSVKLTEEQKKRIKEGLAHRMNKDGQLTLSSQRHRSQHRNKEEVIRRFDECIKRALRPRKKRRGHTRRKAHPERRLEAKRKKAEKKARRGRIRPGDH